jgi:hypothetical protein
VLLAEWVRRVSEEKSLIDDPAQYGYALPNYTETPLPQTQTTNSTTYVLLWQCTLTPADSLKRIKLKRVNWSLSVTSGGTAYLKITAAAGNDPETQICEVQTTGSGWFSGQDTGFAGRLNEPVYVRYYGRVNSSSYTLTLSAPGGTAVRWFTPGWHLLKDYGSITLTKASIVVFSYEAVAPASSAYGNTFIAIGNHKVGGGSIFNGETKTFSGLIVLPSGSYSVKAYGGSGTESRTIAVKNMKLGVVAFSDVTCVNAHTYSQSISITLNSRKTCLGRTLAGNCIVYVQAFSTGTGDTISFADPGETPTYYIRVKVNGEQRKWSVRNQDSGDGGVCGSASAILTVQLSLGEQHTIVIEHYGQVFVTVSVAFSPWLLGADDLSPVLLEFPTGSTIYVVAEPLFADVTKSIKIGRKRGVSLGGGTDYYVTQSGTGIVSLAYTFDYLPTGEPLLAASGLNACISLIGVDVRA